MSRRFLWLLLLAPALAPAAVTLTGDPRSTSTGIAFDYKVDEEFAGEACTWQVSRVNDFGAGYQPENDVNPALFASADKDTRNPSLIEGTRRTFVFGDNVSKRGLDGYVYSRAAKAATSFYFKGSCGTETITFAASTKTVPFGVTRGTPHPADPDHPGEYLHPSRKWNIAGQKIVDPLTGVELTFPVASGGPTCVRTNNAAFRDATSTGWTNPNSAVLDDGVSATISGDNTSPLYIRWDYSKHNVFGSGARTDYDAGGLDYLKVNVTGSGTAESAADRMVEICLTFDGVVCLGPWWDTELPSVMGAAPSIGTGVAGDTLQTPGAIPVARARLHGRSGMFTYVAASKAVMATSGTFSAEWSPGTRFRVEYPALSERIRDASNTAPIRIEVPQHGLSTGNRVRISNIPPGYGWAANNTAALGDWRITVVDEDHFTLDESAGNGNYGTHTAIVDVFFESPCRIAIDGNQGALFPAGTIVRLDNITSTIYGLAPATNYTIESVSTGAAGSPAMGNAIILSLEGTTCSGTFDNTRWSANDFSQGKISAITGQVQRIEDFPIARVDSGTQLTLADGPSEDITTPLTWNAESAGLLIRKKTNSADTVAVQYVTVDYQTSRGFSGGAAGGDACNTVQATKNDGTKGYICIVGNPMLVTAGEVFPLGKIGNKYENITYYTLPQSNSGAFGINPNYPKNGYAMVGGEGLGRPGDRLLQVAVLEGDLADADVTKGPGSYYGGYVGYPFYPNCNGFQAEGTGTRIVPPGQTCVKFYTLGWVRDLVRNYGRQLWRKFAANLTDMDFTAANSIAAVYVPSAGKVHLSVMSSVGQDTPGMIYVFEVDESTTPPTVSVIGEVSTMDREGSDWCTIHGGGGLKNYAPGYVGWACNPVMNLDQGVYWFGFGNSVSPNGPFETMYTAVNGHEGVQMSNSKPVAAGGRDDYGLQSCAAWAGSPYLPTPTPDGVSTTYDHPVLGGHWPTGCTTLKLAGEPCDMTPNPAQQTVMAADAATHTSKCGGAGRYWFQDLRVGGLVALPKSDRPIRMSGADLAVDAYANLQATVSSVSYVFSQQDVGFTIVVIGGNGWTIGNYPIVGIASGKALVAGSPAIVGAASGVYEVSCPFPWYSTCAENARIIAKTGSGPDTEITLYRGGVLPHAWETYQRGAGAQDFSSVGPYRKVLAYTNHPDKGNLTEVYVDYIEYPTDQDGGHQLSGFGHGSRTAAGVAGSSPNPPGYAALFGDFQTQLTKATPDVRAQNVPAFSGHSASDILGVDSHVTWIPDAYKDTNVRWLIDGRPWNGYGGRPGSKVAGTTNVYMWPRATWDTDTHTRLYPKYLPTIARVGTHVLRSVSGPGSVIDDGTPYSYCYAFVAGECRPDSAKDAFYMNAPGLSQIGAERQDGGATDKLAAVDPAFMSATSIVSAYIQWLMTSDMTGRNLRTLTTGFERYRMESPFKNWSVTADGRFGVGITTGLEGVRSEIWMAEMPPVSQDSWDRTGYIDWPIAVPAEAGANNAVIEFGYAAFGDVNGGKLNCIDRDDTCVAAAHQDHVDNPYWFAGADAYAGVPCASGCTITVPVLGNQMLYYRIRWQNRNHTVKTSRLLVLATP